MPMENDLELLKAYLGDPSRERFERVVRAYDPRVCDISFRVTRHAEDAADICQDHFLGLIVKPPPMDRVRSEKGFLLIPVLVRRCSLLASPITFVPQSLM